MPPPDEYDDGDEGTTPPDAPAAGGLYTAGVILATLVTLFAFVGLVALAYRQSGAERPESTRPDPKERLETLRAKNQAVLDGSEPGNPKLLPLDKAAADVVAKASATGELPFPAPPPGQVKVKTEPPPPATKPAPQPPPATKPEPKPAPPPAAKPALEPAPAPRPKK